MRFLAIIGAIFSSLGYLVWRLYVKPFPVASTDNSELEVPIVVPPPAPVVPVATSSKATLENMCLAIRDYEGGPSDRNYRNNNPGNCRYSSKGYLPIYGVVKKDKDNFAIFSTPDLGMLYLHNLIKEKIRVYPEHSLLEFMEVYAPSSDGNNPALYASFIAKRLGVSSAFIMGNLIV